MTRKFLEDLGLDKGLIDKILDEHSAGIGRAKSDLSQVKTERDNLSGKVCECEGIIEELKAEQAEKEALARRVEELETDNKALRFTFESEIAAVKLENAVDCALAEAGARNLKAVKALLDFDKIKLREDGGVTGLAKQLEALQNNPETDFLFLPKMDFSPKGFRPAEKGDVIPDISSMSYSQFIATCNQQN